jgi:hypothetical protein
MSVICEKCWNESANKSGSLKLQVDKYYSIVKHHKCTLKEIAGDYWDDHNKCDRRTTKYEKESEQK